MTEEYNFKSICDLTTRVLGLPTGELSKKSRKRPLQVARAVAAYIGRTEEDIHRTNIAKVLKRDRSLIYYYEHTHDGNYKTCSIYKDTYNKVYKAYKDIEGTKDIFVKGSDIKSYLLKHGVKEAPLYMDDVLLEVKSGESSTIIKTTYLDFSNQLENVKLALKNYHYSINII